MTLFEVSCCINSFSFHLCLLPILGICGVFVCLFTRGFSVAQDELKLTTVFLLSLLSAGDLCSKKNFKTVENSNFVGNESLSEANLP